MLSKGSSSEKSLHALQGATVPGSSNPLTKEEGNSSLYIKGSSAASGCWQPIFLLTKIKMFFCGSWMQCFVFFVTLYWCPSSKRHITALKFWPPSFLLCIFVILGDFLPRARLLREWLSEFTSPTSPHLKKPRGVTHACVGFLLETHEDVRVKMLMSTQSNICKFKGLDANRGELKRSVVLAGQGVNPLIVWKSKQLPQWLSFH